MGYADQLSFFKQVALNNGCPNIRWCTVPRMGTAEERIPTFYDNLIKALTDPLTAKEKEAGLYSPPAPPRILFEGTYDEAYDFLQQTVLVENCRQCPIAKYTDGLPVVIPTEEKVAEMLTGTSHKPTEQIVRPYASSATGQPGGVVTYAQKYTSTVEKVAVTAVMAGCKPQYMPVALAIAVHGGQTTNCPGTSSAAGYMWVVSGPIAKEIGMNPGQNSLDVGNIANMTLGRVGALMSVNFGGCITGLVRTDSGNPVHSVCFAEDLEGLPPGWVGLNEESTYYKDGKQVYFTSKESVIGKIGINWSIVQEHAPGSMRQLLAGTGEGGLAARILPRLGLTYGTPGYYNYLIGFLPEIMNLKGRPGGITMIVHFNQAKGLWDAGYKTKMAVYQWMVDTYWITEGQYEQCGWWNFNTDEGRNIESTSGKPYKDLPDDYKLRAFGNSATGNCLIVAQGFADELMYSLSGGRPSTQPIDPWK